ncbi:MAG: sarcinarray family MAST domain-containing protein [Candidatus Methanoperedens sp.]
MNLKSLFLILTIILLNFQNALGSENDFGIANAWFNGENATVNGIELKIGEPSEIKVEVISKVEGHVFVALTEIGVTKAFDVLNGPSKQDERIDNLNIDKGWSKTFIWKVTPNGAWKNGNAPINIYVGFYNSKSKTDKNIKFTIANPYILDEQYSGAAATLTPAPEIAGTGAPAKPAPFPSVIFMVSALLLAWRLKKS